MTQTIDVESERLLQQLCSQHKTNDSRRLKEEQKLLTKLRVFARLQTSEDFNTLATEMISE